MKTILITGGLGYLGGRISHNLSRGHKVFVSTRGEVSLAARAALPLVSFIPHASLLNSSLFPKEIDTVIHLAALNEIDCVKFPAEAIDVNVNQTRVVLDHAIKNGVKNFLYFSTIHIYGKSLIGKVDELTLPRPIHPYAITHRAAEDYVLAAHDSGKIKAIVVRLSNSFGAPLLPDVNRWTLLVNDVCRQMVTTGKIQLNSRGEQYRDFIPLSKVVKAVNFLVNQDHVGESVFNLSSSHSVTVMEMCELAASVGSRVLKKQFPIIVPESAETSSSIFYHINSTRLDREGFVFENDNIHELEELIQFCKNHFPGQ